MELKKISRASHFSPENTSNNMPKPDFRGGRGGGGGRGGDRGGRGGGIPILSYRSPSLTRFQAVVVTEEAEEEEEAAEEEIEEEEAEAEEDPEEEEEVNHFLNRIHTLSEEIRSQRWSPWRSQRWSQGCCRATQTSGCLHWKGQGGCSPDQEHVAW